MKSQSYTYDLLGNPPSRSDANTNLSESFTYDALSRLTSTTVNLTPGPLIKTFSYSAIGNVLSKSDVGNYSYAPPGSPLPHAVTSTSGGSISNHFERPCSIRPSAIVEMSTMGMETIGSSYIRAGVERGLHESQLGLRAYKPDRGLNRLPVALRQIGTTGNIALHRAPKSVI